MLTEGIIGKNFFYELILAELSPTELPALFAERVMGTTEGTQCNEERTLSLL